MMSWRRGVPIYRAGVIFLVLVAIGVYFAFSGKSPFGHEFVLHADFASSNALRLKSPVRIAGIDVGKVTGIESHGRGARVTMQIDKSGLPIHTDARLAIRPRVFLEGNFFVDLQPGTPSAPKLHDGGTIPQQNNHDPVQLDQVLDALQSTTRQDLSKLLIQYSTALAAGGAEGINKSVPFWKPAYRDSSITNEAFLGQRPHDLSQFQKGQADVSAALDSNPAELRSLIVDFDRTAGAFAAQQGNLEQTVAQLPRTLHAAMPALADLNASFPHVRALTADLRPAVRSSGPAIDASMPFIRQARLLVSQAELRGLVADLRPTVPSLSKLTTETVPLLSQTRAASSCQNEVILPWSNDKVGDAAFPAKQPVFEEATKPLVGLAGESRNGDANGKWFHTLIGDGPFSYTLGSGLFGQTTFPLLGVNPPKSSLPPNREDVPCETQQTPDLTSTPGPPPQQVQTTSTSPLAKSRYLLAEARGEEALREMLIRAGDDDRASQVEQKALAFAKQLTPTQLDVLKRDVRNSALPAKERLKLP